MKKILPILLLILLCGCDSESNDFVYQEYQLPASSSDLNLNIEKDEATIINEKSEFQEVFGDYPNAKSIDFKKYTLLLTRGVSSSGIAEIQKTILKTDGGKYVFTITVKRNAAAVMEPWYLAYIIPKTNEADITCKIDYDLYEWKE
jgi:hypothetical protein